VFGAIAGFGVGLLLDIATLGTLGVTALLFTVAGFWIGRYGETTARDRSTRRISPSPSSPCCSPSASWCSSSCSAKQPPAGPVLHGLPLGLLLNLILTLPVYALVRRLFPPLELGDRVREVRLLG
jgi:hypothetical protein